MTCIKKGLSELALNRPSIKEVKSALPMPLFAFWVIFEFLRFTYFKLFLLCFAVTFGQDYLWTLCSRITVVFFKTYIVSTKKISLIRKYRLLGDQNFFSSWSVPWLNVKTWVDFIFVKTAILFPLTDWCFLVKMRAKKSCKLGVTWLCLSDFSISHSFNSSLYVKLS